MSRTSPRKLHIEALRIVAALFVLFNHTGEEGFFLFAAWPSTSPLCWAYLSLSILCKAAVPLFFMASGALLLKILSGFFLTVLLSPVKTDSSVRKSSA